MSETLPMFPLGAVLFPTMVLPLHVFEPRYRVLAHDVTSGDGRFGVVLIERGSEVGGDDIRTDVGTIAEVVEAEELDDGRWVVAAVGRERLSVERWLDDDPYPRAEISPVIDRSTGADLDHDLWSSIRVTLRQTLALQAELGEAKAPIDVELSPEPAIASLQIGAIGPFGPSDQQRILAITDPAQRLRTIADLLTDAAELLEARLGA